MPKKRPNWHFWAFWARPCWLIWCPVGGLASGCGVRALSRKKTIYFILFNFVTCLWVAVIWLLMNSANTEWWWMSFARVANLVLHSQILKSKPPPPVHLGIFLKMFISNIFWSYWPKGLGEGWVCHHGNMVIMVKMFMTEMVIMVEMVIWFRWSSWTGQTGQRGQTGQTEFESKARYNTHFRRWCTERPSK